VAVPSESVVMVQPVLELHVTWPVSVLPIAGVTVAVKVTDSPSANELLLDLMAVVV
jgi:hypothetical protein